MIITTILGAVIVFSIALLTNRLAEAGCFFAVFVLTRQFCGGYHSKTRLRCSITFLICYLSVLFFNTVLELIFSWFIHFLFIVPCLSAIFGYAPIVNENKPLTEHEIKVNRKRSIVISIVWVAISTVLLFFKPTLSSAIDMTLLIVSVMIMIEVENRKEDDL